MTKFLVMMLALTAAWVLLLLSGFIAVKVLQFAFRLSTAVLAGLVLATAWAVGLLTRPLRATVRWAIRRLEPGVRFDRPANTAFPIALPVAARVPVLPARAETDGDEILFASDCGHLNRPRAKFCGSCGAALTARSPARGSFVVYLPPASDRRA